MLVGELNQRLTRFSTSSHRTSVFTTYGRVQFDVIRTTMYINTEKYFIRLKPNKNYKFYDRTQYG